MKRLISFINSINRRYKQAGSRPIVDPLLADIYRIKEVLGDASIPSTDNQAILKPPVEVITEYHRLIDLAG